MGLTYTYDIKGNIKFIGMVECEDEPYQISSDVNGRDAPIWLKRQRS